MKATFLTESNKGKPKNHLHGACGHIEVGQGHVHHEYIGVVGKANANIFNSILKLKYNEGIFNILINVFKELVMVDSLNKNKTRSSWTG